MSKWLESLRTNPLPSLIATADRALTYFVRRDLMNEEVGPVELLWNLPQAQMLLRKQQANGSWRYPGQNRLLYPETNYDLLETFRSLGQLVQKLGFDRRHVAIERAASYLFSCQTEEGDIRGILGTQYMPYYHSMIMGLLIEAGYGDDPRVIQGLEWLLSMRQDDGGWIVPMQAVSARWKTREMWSAPPLPPDRSRPHAHMATGMVLRALAVHPQYRHRPEVQSAAACLKSRFFQADRYGDRKAPFYWTKFQYPFWWNNILTALDALSLLDFSPDDREIQSGLNWFIEHQQGNGLWQTGYEQAKRTQMSAKETEAMLWVGLAVCRVFKRFLA